MNKALTKHSGAVRFCVMFLWLIRGGTDVLWRKSRLMGSMLTAILVFSLWFRCCPLLNLGSTLSVAAFEVGFLSRKRESCNLGMCRPRKWQFLLQLLVLLTLGGVLQVVLVMILVAWSLVWVWSEFGSP